MSKVDKYVPIWIADYLADTTRLTTEQHGAYLLMIFDYWRNGPPPNDQKLLAQITKLDAKKWKKNAPTLLRFFEKKDGLLVHKRIEQELTKSKTQKQANIDRARAGAEARWGKTQDAQSNATSIPTSSPSSNATSKTQALLKQPPTHSSEDAISEYRYQSLDNKSSSSSSKDDDEDIFKNKSDSPNLALSPEIEAILEKVLKIRIEQGKEEGGDPVESVRAYRDGLLKSYHSDPEIELSSWKAKIEVYEKNREKQGASDTAKQDRDKQIAELEKSFEDEKNRLAQNREFENAMACFGKLSKLKQDDLWSEAKAKAKSMLSGDNEPQKPIIEFKLVELMRERGLVYDHA